MHVTDMRRYSSSKTIFRKFQNLVPMVTMQLAEVHRLAEVRRYHQFQPLFTIFMTLLEKSSKESSICKV